MRHGSSLPRNLPPVFGLNILIGLSIPMWVIGVLAGVLLIREHFRVRVDRK